MAADPIIYCLEQATDYEQFERFCHDLMALEGFPNIEPLGGHKDKGRDAIDISRTVPNDVTIFAYSVREDWRKKLTEDSEKIFGHGHPCHRLVFLCTAKFTSAQRDEAVAAVRNTYGWKLELYGLERLRILLATRHERILVHHPQLFCPRFFTTASDILLTSRAESVLESYCRHRIDEWECARRDAEDPDRLAHYVAPHFSLLQQGQAPGDSGESIAHSRIQAQRSTSIQYERISAQDETEELTKLLQTSHRLCVTQDSGMGKSVFTRRLQAFLSGPDGRNAFFHGKPPLVARWEHIWPDALHGFRDRLAAEVQTICENEDGSLDASDIVSWALRHDRVVVVLDALDQVCLPHSLLVLTQFLNSDDGRRCRFVVTSRSYAVQQCNSVFQGPGWRFARIEAFDEQQQAQYLAGLYQWRVSDLFDHTFPEPSDLLRIPAVLAMLRLLAEAKVGGGEPMFFHFKQRVDVYLQASRYLLNRAANKDPAVVFDLRKQRRIEEILSAIAFEMMYRQMYSYTALTSEVLNVQDAVNQRCDGSVTEDEWLLVKKISMATDHRILEGFADEILSWSNRGMMEFYAARYLAKFAKHLRSEDISAFGANEQWYWTWRFAIELKETDLQGNEFVDDVVLRDSLSAVFLRPSAARRPSELICRSWSIMEMLPGGREVINLYQNEYLEMLDVAHPKQETARRINASFVRIPPVTHPMQGNLTFRLGFGRVSRVVSVSSMFFLTQSRVTNAQYELFDPEHVHERDRYQEHDEESAGNVSWYDGWCYARWLGGYLPKEEELYFAVRSALPAALVEFGKEDEANRKRYLKHWRCRIDNSGTPVDEACVREWGLCGLFNQCESEWCEGSFDAQSWYADGQEYPKPVSVTGQQGMCIRVTVSVIRPFVREKAEKRIRTARRTERLSSGNYIRRYCRFWTRLWSSENAGPCAKVFVQIENAKWPARTRTIDPTIGFRVARAAP